MVLIATVRNDDDDIDDNGIVLTEVMMSMMV